MRHRPHLYLPAPWQVGEIELDDAKRRHLSSVLRYPDGSPVTYTDGFGTVGSGHVEEGRVLRGDEHAIAARSPVVTIASAVPRSKDRQRFLVEKLQELGTAHLRWMATERSQVGGPSSAKTAAWCVGALEQSRGAWLMTVDTTSLTDLGDAIVADPAGNVPVDRLRDRDAVTLIIGPEGGLTETELGRFDERLDLGSTILRTETAAVVAAALTIRRDI